VIRSRAERQCSQPWPKAPPIPSPWQRRRCESARHPGTVTRRLSRLCSSVAGLRPAVEDGVEAVALPGATEAGIGAGDQSTMKWFFSAAAAPEIQGGHLGHCSSSGPSHFEGLAPGSLLCRTRSRGERQEPTRAPRQNGPRTEEGRIPSDHTCAAHGRDRLNHTPSNSGCFRSCSISTSC
jgi:hypothetical protein